MTIDQQEKTIDDTARAIVVARLQMVIDELEGPACEAMIMMQYNGGSEPATFEVSVPEGECLHVINVGVS